MAASTRISMKNMNKFRYAEETPIAFFMRHVARGVDVNQEANTGNDQEHDNGQLIELKVKASAEIAGYDPIEEWFNKRLMLRLIVTEKFAHRFDSTQKGKSCSAQSDRMDDFVRPLPSQQAIQG